MKRMQEYTQEIKRTLLKMVIWGLFICGSFYIAGYGWRIPGLVMGITSSIIYCLLLWYRIHNSVEMPVHKAILYMRLGLVVRLLFIVIMLFISLRMPVFDFGSAVVGLFTLQIVMILQAGVFVVKNLLHLG